MRYIIDTDLGDDPDDALAIALALTEEMDICAITTVREMSEVRAQLVQTLLACGGRAEIPVATGSAHPLLTKNAQNRPLFYDLVERSYTLRLHPTPAAHLIAHLLENEPAPALITLGPLTNIALVALWRPDLVPRMRIFCMGGALLRSRPEFNMRWDAAAAHIVLSSGASVYMVGLDVTLSCPLIEPLREQLFARTTPTSQWLQRAIIAWQKEHPQKTIFLHDPMAVALALEPSLAHTQSFDMCVELHGQYSQGHTVPLTTAGILVPSATTGSVQVCTTFDYDRFYTRYASRIGIS